MARIVIFDSGVGGLSVLQAMQQHPELQQTNHQWIFCSDNAFFPYGTRSETLLVARVLELLDVLERNYQPDLIVLACNTASTVALAQARAKFSTPIVGVVPAIKPAARISNSKVIGLLATPATIQRPYTQQLIDQFASDCQIVRVGSSALVKMAEQYLRNTPVNHPELYQILSPLREAIRQQHLDTVVLACTHFPLLLDALMEQLPEVTHWIDSGEAIARRVSAVLQELQEQTGSSNASPENNGQQAANLALFTRDDDDIALLQHQLRRLGLHQVQRLSLALPPFHGAPFHDAPFHDPP